MTREHEEARTRLKNAGLKVTEPRLVVMQALAKHGNPISHGDLAERLGAALDKVTVWRVLVALTDADIVSRTDAGDRTWRFSLRGEGNPPHDPRGVHPHFVCTTCKTVACLPKDAMKLRVGRGVRVTDVQVKGICAACA